MTIFRNILKDQLSKQADRSLKTCFPGPKTFSETGPELLKTCLAATSFYHHRNAQGSILLNKWPALTILRATDLCGQIS